MNIRGYIIRNNKPHTIVDGNVVQNGDLVLKGNPINNTKNVFKNPKTGRFELFFN